MLPDGLLVLVLLKMIASFLRSNLELSYLSLLNFPESAPIVNNRRIPFELYPQIVVFRENEQPARVVVKRLSAS